MVIDLNIDFEKLVNYTSEYRVKSVKLLTALNRLNNKMSRKYNYIIIPMSVYNIIECCDDFKPSFYDNKEGLKKVGFIGEFECYLDIHLKSDEIILSWDKATSREIKIESILSGSNIEFEKRIEIMF